MYKRVYQDYDYKYEAYIPTAYVYNEYAPATVDRERNDEAYAVLATRVSSPPSCASAWRQQA